MAARRKGARDMKKKDRHKKHKFLLNETLGAVASLL